MFQPNSPQWVTIVVTFVFAAFVGAAMESSQAAAFFAITGALIVWWLEGRRGRRQKRNELEQSWRHLEDPENPENRNAGNGGDLVKHTIYVATLDYLLAHAPWSREIRVRECHAGRGVYTVPHDDTARRPLLTCLFKPVGLDVGVLLHDAQRAVQTYLGTWPTDADSIDRYGGSPVLNACRLDRAREGHHLLELYEQAPDTRRILRAVLAAFSSQWSSVDVRVVPDPDDESAFDGERHIEKHISTWDIQDLVLLDPFAIWRQDQDRPRRDRYRRIIDTLVAQGEEAPALILFWTWGRAFPVARGDLDGTSEPAANGYQDLRSVLHGADKPFIRVTWCWGLQFAMWVSVPHSHLEPLRAVLQQRCDELLDHLDRQGCGRRLANPTVEVRVD